MLSPADASVHLLVAGPLPPDWNMALDEALLRGRQEGAIHGTWIRLFAWSPAAISIGRLQAAGEDLDLAAAAQDGIPIVRRATGGKAVLHAREVTYSLIGGVPDPEWGGNLHETYRRVSAILIAGLERLGVETAFAPRRPTTRKLPGGDAGMGDLAAACFAVAYGHELVAGGRKICGSAQRRLTRAFLQHGSLLLGPEQAELARYLRVPGDRQTLTARLQADTTDVASAAGRPITREELTEAIVRGLEARFGTRLERGMLPSTIRASAERLRPEVRVGGFQAAVDTPADGG
jgi:lipoate-protein ligase A